MKALIARPFPFTPISRNLSKVSPFASKSILCNPRKNVQILNFFYTKPITTSPSFLVFWLQNRYLNTKASSSSSSGELPVIVGPMFAGKTTTLLRRILAETEKGSEMEKLGLSLVRYSSFQVEQRKSLVQLDKTLKGLCFSGRLSEAVGLLWQMGLKADHGTYALMLQECLFRKEYKLGRRIHAQMVIIGYDCNKYNKTKLLILYAKSGDLVTAHVLFDKLQDKSLIPWNAMIAGYVQKGFEEVGLSFYYKMRENGLTPDQYTFASVFRACAALAMLEHGKQAHGVMLKCHISENVVVNSALVDMYFKCSSISDGNQVFDKSLNRNVVTWTALISGYGQHGRVLQVLESFHRMKDAGFRPNYVTFLAVLSACSHGGLVNEGWDYFSSMARDYGIQPRGQHYAAMVDLLGRAGRLQEAYEFVLCSPCKEHSGVWGALLGACRIHGDMDLTKLAAEKFFELEQGNAGKYVVLANAYATVGSWENVAEVRDTMRDLGVIKEPGYSRIELQGVVHFFLMGDKSHKHSEEIYEVITEMTCILKDAGYVPNSNC